MIKMNSNIKESYHDTYEEYSEKAFVTPDILPYRYVFVLTNKCNLNCNFCFQGENLKKDNLTANQWLNVAKQLPENSRVTFTGGEPFMFPKFKEIFSFVASRHDCNIITNGLLLTEDLIDFLLSYDNFKVLSISIDNIGNTIRGVKPHQWMHLKKMMLYFTEKKRAMDHNCNLDVKTMILDETVDNLYETYKYLREELKVDTHAFQFLKGSKIQHADKAFDFSDIFAESHSYRYKNFNAIIEQLELIRNYNIENGTVSFLHPKFDLLTTNYPIINMKYYNFEQHHKKYFQDCKYPWASAHINFDGDVFPCLAITLGSVKSNNLKQIFGSDKCFQFRETIRKEGTVEACNRCGWLKLKEGLK